MSNKKILVLNAGSSSIKFQAFDSGLNLLAKGLCERIFIDGSFEISVVGSEKVKKAVAFPDHQSALRCVLQHLRELNVIANPSEIAGAGHRVAQGGDHFSGPAAVDATNLARIMELSKLAPLHNPHQANVISLLADLVPGCVNVAVFDTTFHATIPPHNRKYAIPAEWETKHHVRRYGFHGTSYEYVTERMGEHLGKDKPDLVVCHLGNGASIAAIKGGRSHNTSMGFTPLEGLIMGTRSGSVDAAVVDYMCAELKATPAQVTDVLNKKSGMLALTGSSDMRDVFANKQKNETAIAMYAQRVADHVVSFVNQLGGNVDGIVFTGGVGENGSEAIERIVAALPLLGLRHDPNALRDRSYDDVKRFSLPESRYALYQIRTNEELMIAKTVLRFLRQPA